MNGERVLLLWNGEPKKLRESHDDVATTQLLCEGWEDVTGVPEYEERCTKDLHGYKPPMQWGA